jgi:hypothetical protein
MLDIAFRAARRQAWKTWPRAREVQRTGEPMGWSR